MTDPCVAIKWHAQIELNSRSAGIARGANTANTSVPPKPSVRCIKPAFHDTDPDTDIPAKILADSSDTRDFLKSFLWQAERGSRPRHADILGTILARMSVSVSCMECGLYRIVAVPGVVWAGQLIEQC